LKSNKTTLLFTLICICPGAVIAEDFWQLDSAATTITGHYLDSQTMYNLHGLGIRLSAENNRQWGLSVGLQSTRTNTKPITQTSKQDQDNLLLSGFIYIPSTNAPGRWTFQVDMHQIINDAKQRIGSDVQVIAPQIAWFSYTQPLKMDISYANSTYNNTATIRQLSTSVAFGVNEAKDWLQIRSYFINNLPPSTPLGKTNTNAADIKLTHFLSNEINWAPNTITLGIERGKRIYVVDMATQAVNNLPMMNEGGENIAAAWNVNNKSKLAFQFSRNRYFSELLTSHRFKLDIFSAQYIKAW
jgi:hypothetical protein